MLFLEEADSRGLRSANFSGGRVCGLCICVHVDSADTMFYGAALPVTMAEGDRVYVASAGAYTLSYASHFNGFPPPRAVFING